MWLLFNCMALEAQDNRVSLQGNIRVESNDVDGIHVQNTTSNKATITDGYGFFSILVQLNDTLVFSAIQFKKKEFVITQSLLESKSIVVLMEEADNQLDEVVVMPYNLSGDLSKDADNLKDKVVTASTLGLPNAYVKKKTQNERKLAEADGGGWFNSVGGGIGGVGGAVNLHKILNRVSGRTKMLKERVARDEKNELIAQLNSFYADTLITKKLKIPELRINEFFFYCEVDANFASLVQSKDVLTIWEFLEHKSKLFRENNDLD